MARAKGTRRLVAGAVVVVLVAVVALLAERRVFIAPWSPGCTAAIQQGSVTLDLEQAQNAATIAGVGQKLGVPPHATTIALAAAYQESDLRNLDHGDRDSLGLFQQRPSQGWGTPQQLQDPVYAATAFYRALVKVPGYLTLPVTQAAQRVQRSGFPDAYGDHEQDARVLASALRGQKPAAFSCRIPTPEGPRQSEGASGLTPRAAAVRAELTRVFGSLPLGGFAPGGVSTGHMEGSAHYDGRAIDVFFRPVGDATQHARGWTVAEWAVAHADALKIATVIYDDRIWTAARSEQGWRAYAAPSGPGNPDTLRHRDHVHIDVVAGS
ncbi:MAG: hypothetical protein ACTHNT_11510 [Actinomycetales bacterium]